MTKIKSYNINFIYLLGTLIFPMMVSAQSDTCMVIPTPSVSANTPVCENGTLKLETPFQNNVIFHWYNPQGIEISVVATASVPAMQQVMAGDYSLIVEQAGCFSNPATINISVTPRPDTPMVFNNGPLCEGETLELDGPSLANTEYKWIDPFGTVISNEEDVTIQNIPRQLAGDYFLEIKQFGCESPLGGTEVGVIAVNEVPELTLSSPACEGDSLLIRGPHVSGANYNWKGPNGFQSDNIDSLLFPAINTDLTGVFTLVLEASGCESPKGEIEVVVYSKPSATLSGGGVLCEGESMELMVNLSGKAPFEFIYAIDEVEQPAVMTSEAAVNLSISPSESSTYNLLGMSDKSGCPATLEGIANIAVFSKPDIELITDTICDPTNENYQIRVNIKKGVQPFDYQGVGGGLTDTVFTSEYLASGQSYVFQVQDKNNCLSEQISGQFNCPCTTYAGSVDLRPLDICGTEQAEILPIETGNLDPNDHLIFVLHDSPSTELGNILATAKNPIFEMPDNLTIGQTYFISPVAGNRMGNQIDLSDRCLSVGQGTPISFSPIPPQPIISGEQSICPGAALALTATSFVGPLTYRWETPIDIIETTTANLIIDPVSADYSGPFRVSVIKDGCASHPSEEYTIEVAIPAGQADAGVDTISCGSPKFYLDAQSPAFGFGTWIDDNLAFVEDVSDPKSRISSLQEGLNTFYWVLSTEDCPFYERDSVTIAYRPNALAMNDIFILPEEETFLDFDVLANDILPEGHEIWVEEYRLPHEGFIEEIEDGYFSYRRPFNSFEGDVVLEYLLCFETPTCPVLCDTAGVNINVMRDPTDPGVYIPDGITPNNDGVNDFLIIQGLENYENNELLIFDRWGSIVYESKPYKNTWAGNYNNSTLPEGTYYYILKTDIANKKTLKGSVYIIR